MDMKPIIVMAGTPVDTQMGMDCPQHTGIARRLLPDIRGPQPADGFSDLSHGGKDRHRSLPSVRGAAGAWLRKSLHLLQFSFRRAGFPVRCPGNRLEDRHAARRLPAAGAQISLSGRDRRQRSGHRRNRADPAQCQPGPDPALYRTSACGVGDRGRRGPRYAGETEPSAGACELVSGRWVQRRWCLAAPTSPISKRLSSDRSPCRSLTPQRKCSAC